MTVHSWLLTRVRSVLVTTSLSSSSATTTYASLLPRSLSLFKRKAYKRFTPQNMGSRFSSSNSPTTTAAQAPTAKVVAVDGSLREYSAAVRVARVLDPHPPSCFLCNADSLYYDAYIPPMGPGELLQLGQLYFVLPDAMLESPLAGQVMVALAVRASSAIDAASEKHGRRRRFRVMPVSEVSGGVDDGEVVRSDEKSNGVFRPAVSVHRKARRIGSASRVGSARRGLSRERLSAIPEIVE